MNELCRRYQESFDMVDIASELVEHARTCKNCQAFAKRQAAMQNLLPSWSAAKPSENFALDVMSRIAESNYPQKSLRELMIELLRVRLSVPLPIGALAIVLLFISLGFNLFSWNGNQTGNVHVQSNQPVVVSPSFPTPATVHASNPGAFLPHTWNGAGAFLLIPMMDMNLPFIHIDETQETNTNETVDKI